MNINHDIFRGKLFVNFIKKYIKNLNQLEGLDVGCRYGAFTIELAKNLKKIVAIDVDEGALEILKEKSKEIKNIQIINESILKTNFPDNKFDLITLEGVLEWVGLGDRNKSPKECQIQAIKECKRILKNGGILYCGIENRLFPAYWLRDPHSHLPLTVILPRFLSQIYYASQTPTKDKYYGQNIMSYWGYVKMFSKVFGNCDVRIPLPNYKYLYYVSTFNSKEVLKKALKVLRIKGLRKTYLATTLAMRAIALLHLYKFSNNFIFLCKK